MFQRKECKKTARKSLRAHYAIFVFLCLAAAILGTNYTSSYTLLTHEIKYITTGGDPNAENVNSRWQINEALSDVLEDAGQSKALEANLIERQQEEQSAYIGNHLELGHYRGVLAGVRNELVSGAFLLSAATALTRALGSSTAAMFVLLLLAFSIAFAGWMFITNVFKVVYARMFLEGRIYRRVPLQRLAFPLYIKRWRKIACTMLLKTLYYNLWTLTVVGGFIKYYSYFAVPYIMAENPDIPARKAIKLSREMMYGHKWECFKLRLSFIGWGLLDAVTFGLSGILYSNPYKEACMCEYYAHVRALAREKGIEGTEQLVDEYLFRLPDEETLRQAYGTLDASRVIQENRSDTILSLISDFFGVYLSRSAYEAERKRLKDTNDYLQIRNILNQEQYGYRLLPIQTQSRRPQLEQLNCNRKYSVWSLFLIFIFISFLGWVWEVSLHLIQTGQFVNRGTLHGPWLPIYGTGTLLILLVLNLLRSKPMAEFCASVVLCGCVEYFSAWMLEMTHNGQKWWDYSGYFLNLDGRVCAEGLIAFGIGGMLVVYLVAPLLDNLILKIPAKAVVNVSLALLLVFGTDYIYSGFHPNAGPGITDTSGEAPMPEADSASAP